MNNKPSSLSRNDFLHFFIQGFLYLSAILWGYIIVQYFSHQTPKARRQTADLGTYDQFPDGTTSFLKAQGLLVLHKEGQPLRVLSLKCPHLGCYVTQEGDHLACPCHGSRFTLTGELKRGPATASLSELAYQKTAQERLLVELETLPSGE